jgi:hypothetical protein
LTFSLSIFLSLNASAFSSSGVRYTGGGGGDLSPSLSKIGGRYGDANGGRGEDDIGIVSHNTVIKLGKYDRDIFEGDV